MRVVAAMSGGVDSSVAAALLHEGGHDVVGVSMQLHDQTGGEGPSFGRCCALDDLHDAKAVAARLGIPHYVVNLERSFQDDLARALGPRTEAIARAQAGGGHGVDGDRDLVLRADRSRAAHASILY